MTSVFPFVDPGPRTAVVEAVVDNPGRRFLSGQYVQMEFVTGERAGALTVLRAAVSRMGGKTTVWVVQDGRAEPREVTTGLESPERIEITRGLRGDERVIARGHEGLYAGARVAEASGGADAPTQKTMPRRREAGSPGPSRDKGGPGMPGMRH